MSLRVRLSNVKCIRESDEVSASDEIYVIVTAVQFNRTPAGLDLHRLGVSRYGIWENFDAGESAVIGELPFWGLRSVPEDLNDPSEVFFVVSLMENDNGDPNQYRGLVEIVAQAAMLQTLQESNRAVRAQRVANRISAALNGIDLPIPFALDDDHIGTRLLQLGQDDLVPFGARTRTLSIDGGDEGHYELSFEIARIRVAANPQDRHVLTMGNRILVITSDGKVFAHDMMGFVNTLIGVPYQLGGPPVAANPQDRHVLTMGNRILVIVDNGGVFGHEVVDNTVGPVISFSGPPVAAHHDVDRFVVTMGNRILVTVNDGRVFAHNVAGNTISPAFQMS